MELHGSIFKLCKVFAAWIKEIWSQTYHGTDWWKNGLDWKKCLWNILWTQHEAWLKLHSFPFERSCSELAYNFVKGLLFKLKLFIVILCETLFFKIMSKKGEVIFKFYFWLIAFSAYESRDWAAGVCQYQEGEKCGSSRWETCLPECREWLGKL